MKREGGGELFRRFTIGVIISFILFYVPLAVICFFYYINLYLYLRISISWARIIILGRDNFL